MPVRALESESSAYSSFATDAYATTMKFSNNLQHNAFQNDRADSLHRKQWCIGYDVL